MNWDRIEGNWKQFKGHAKAQWGKLTDDDFDVVEGRRDQLVGRIQERYGIAKDEADRQVNDWLGKDDDYFVSVRQELQKKRDRFAAGLAQSGFPVLPSAGTYFIPVDLAPLGVGDDAAFCERLLREAGVVAIPVSAFYEEEPVKTVLRFCFAKSDTTLDSALERLSRLDLEATAAAAG